MTEQDSVAGLLRRIGWRILPVLIVLYVIAFLDRVNIGFAAASMQRDLHFSDSLYGTGAGIFFLGYILAQVPSNLTVARFGARRTIACLMVSWSLVSAAIAFVHTPAEFLFLRFLLGVAEAGFYPGVILYLTLWLPRRVRTGYMAWFIFAIPLASILGGPLSAWILQFGTVGPFHDWQMLLLTQALPALVAGACVPFLLSDSPQQAAWLNEEERSLLAPAWQADEPIAVRAGGVTHPRLAFGSPGHIARFALIYFGMQFAIYAQSFWMPKILLSMHVRPAQLGWDVAIVYTIAALGILAWGRISDRSPRRGWTLGVPLFVGALGYAATALPEVQTTVVLLAFGVGAAGELAATSAFWARVTLEQDASKIAGMIALINALGILGGFVGPTLFGRLQQSYGSHAAGMLVAAASMLLGCVLVYFPRTEAARPEK